VVRLALADGADGYRADRAAAKESYPLAARRIIRTRLHSSEIVRIRDVPVSKRMRTAVDLALHLPVPDALAVLDGACRLGGVPTRGLRRELRRLGRPKLALLGDLMNPARASVYESLFFFLMFETRCRCRAVSSRSVAAWSSSPAPTSPGPTAASSLRSTGSNTTAIAPRSRKIGDARTRW
jgi:hypothetical protein